MVITQAAQLQDLTDEQIEEIAQTSLTWDSRFVDSMADAQGLGRGQFNRHSGHANFRLRGYPARFHSMRFTSRRGYLMYRLQRKLSTGRQESRVLYDATGKSEANAVLAEQRKKAAMERARKVLAKPMGLKLSITSEAEIEEYKGHGNELPLTMKFWTNPMNRHNTPYKESGIWQFQRSTNSKSRRICTQNAALHGPTFMGALKQLSNQNELTRQLVEIQKQLKLPEGVKTNASTTPAVGWFQIRDHYNSGEISFRIEEHDGVNIVNMHVQGYPFLFKLTDLLALEKMLGDPSEYELVHKETKERVKVS